MFSGPWNSDMCFNMYARYLYAQGRFSMYTRRRSVITRTEKGEEQNRRQFYLRKMIRVELSRHQDISQK